MKSLRWLLLAGCGEKRPSQPVRFRLAGIADCLPDGFCFFRWQTNRKNINRDTFLRQPRTARFLLHKKFMFRVRKYLTGFWAFVYKRQVSKFETMPFQQS